MGAKTPRELTSFFDRAPYRSSTRPCDDPRANFVAIRDRRLWQELEDRRRQKELQQTKGTP